MKTGIKILIGVSSAALIGFVGYKLMGKKTDVKAEPKKEDKKEEDKKPEIVKITKDRIPFEPLVSNIFDSGFVNPVASFIPTIPTLFAELPNPVKEPVYVREERPFVPVREEPVYVAPTPAPYVPVAVEPNFTFNPPIRTSEPVSTPIFELNLLPDYLVNYQLPVAVSPPPVQTQPVFTEAPPQGGGSRSYRELVEAGDDYSDNSYIAYQYE
jgi:hypothetical protein